MNKGITNKEMFLDFINSADILTLAEIYNKCIINSYSTNKPLKLLQYSFCYIIDPITNEKAILMSIHKKWFDMIMRRQI